MKNECRQLNTKGPDALGILRKNLSSFRDTSAPGDFSVSHQIL